MDIYGEMSRSEARKLSPEDKKLRRKYQNRISNKIYRQNNKEKIAKRCKLKIEEQNRFYQENKEKEAELNKLYLALDREKVTEYLKIYRQTDIGKKNGKIKQWKSMGLIETKVELERIYNLYLNQELCNACDIILTRTGKNSVTDANMNHCKKTGRFQHIICGTCNINDKWKDYFC